MELEVFYLHICEIILLAVAVYQLFYLIAI